MKLCSKILPQLVHFLGELIWREGSRTRLHSSHFCFPILNKPSCQQVHLYPWITFRNLPASSPLLFSFSFFWGFKDLKRE
ncbi:hypothetical protein J5N97_009976 [Dioscorea zingiberensis]|uniref:Uncharacterized protein n=1 Tax=Dioscorea zingiberensis TaxID=325984 RepID=A0A9D5HME1_9LILI|nr:hypothetical protein J5N97_009976 [Dioscorea zingiberensis]